MQYKYIKNGLSLELAADKCNGCGMCLDVCPHQVFKLDGGRAEVIDRSRCMECGACAKNCPRGAIKVNAGVGCAYAIIRSGSSANPECGCSGSGGTACCG